ncbi:MAG: GAF domain-containing protein, partial [Proteobacteria bacterium]|nr:GAF domain-containing protein [Pseudomonadota bacterium]
AVPKPKLQVEVAPDPEGKVVPQPKVKSVSEPKIVAVPKPKPQVEVAPDPDKRVIVDREPKGIVEEPEERVIIDLVPEERIVVDLKPEERAVFQRDETPVKKEKPKAIKKKTKASVAKIKKKTKVSVAKMKQESQALAKFSNEKSGDQEIFDENDAGMIQAFERMQGIYRIKEHDDAAAFALSLAIQIIQCEAGSCMLTAPGTDHLYTAAAEGAAMQSMLGKRFSPANGIVGEATRTRVVINVSNPTGDPLFEPTSGWKNTYKIRNVLCAPIHYKGQTIGTIELVNSPRAEGFVQSEADVLSYICKALAEFADVSLPDRDAFKDEDFARVNRKK